MSNEAITWAWKRDVRSGPKFVLIALADYADEEWSCFPGIPTIAARVGSSESAARSNLDKLIEAGLVVVVRRHRANGSRTSNRYVLAPGLPPESGAGPSAGIGDDLAPESGEPTAGIRGGKKNPQGNPQSEPSASPSEAPAALVVIEPTPDDAFERAWKTWPRGEQKKLARERFHRAVSKKRIRAEDLALAIARHGTVYAAWPTSELEYVPYLSSWLNGERWGDPEPQPKNGTADRNVVAQGRRVYEQLLAEEAAKREADTRGIA